MAEKKKKKFENEKIFFSNADYDIGKSVSSPFLSFLRNQLKIFEFTVEYFESQKFFENVKYFHLFSIQKKILKNSLKSYISKTISFFHSISKNKNIKINKKYLENSIQHLQNKLDIDFNNNNNDNIFFFDFSFPVENLKIEIEKLENFKNFLQNNLKINKLNENFLETKSFLKSIKKYFSHLKLEKEIQFSSECETMKTFINSLIENQISLNKNFLFISLCFIKSQEKIFSKTQKGLENEEEIKINNFIGIEKKIDKKIDINYKKKIILPIIKNNNKNKNKIQISSSSSSSSFVSSSTSSSSSSSPASSPYIFDQLELEELCIQRELFDLLVDI